MLPWYWSISFVYWAGNKSILTLNDKVIYFTFDSGQKGVLPVLDRECNVPVYIYTCLGQFQSYYMYLQDSFTGEHVHIYSRVLFTGPTDAVEHVL